jgi:proteic killer suppression protein
MIKSFNDRRLKRLYERGDRTRLAADMVDKIENILGVLDRAKRLEAMNLPGFRLHALTGDLAGYWSVTVRASWRVIFRFEDGNAFDVDLIDYH